MTNINPLSALKTLDGLGLRYHAAIPQWAKIEGLQIRAIPECEGGGFMLKRDQAEALMRVVVAMGCLTRLHPKEDWCDDDGDVIWYDIDEDGDICSRPYVGSLEDIEETKGEFTHFSHVPFLAREESPEFGTEFGKEFGTEFGKESQPPQAEITSWWRRGLAHLMGIWREL